MLIPPNFVFLHFSKAGGTFRMRLAMRVKADSSKLEHGVRLRRCTTVRAAELTEYKLTS